MADGTLSLLWVGGQTGSSKLLIVQFIRSWKQHLLWAGLSETIILGNLFWYRLCYRFILRQKNYAPSWSCERSQEEETSSSIFYFYNQAIYCYSLFVALYIPYLTAYYILYYFRTELVNKQRRLSSLYWRSGVARGKHCSSEHRKACQNTLNILLLLLRVWKCSKNLFCNSS